MYVITNRNLNENAEGLDIFEKIPNKEGPNELRLLEVVPNGKTFKTRLLDDKLSSEEVQELIHKYDLDINPSADWYASLRVACEVMEQARTQKKHILVFVHGYNNDLGDIMTTAAALESLYNVIVVPFTWPANGGGAVSGTAAYLKDKQDARVSADALMRLIGKVDDYHQLLTAGMNKRLWRQASEKYPDNHQAAYACYTALQEKECKVKISLLCHSMGNYVLKYALKPGSTAAAKLVFDNISLVAADANNQGHEEWVQRLQVRHRLYVVINENDYALGWSRRKPGQEQLARLGHYLKNLIARNAFYLDVTGASWVKNDHAYFKGQPVEKNDRLKQMFRALFEGGTAEDKLRYQPDLNAYILAD